MASTRISEHRTYQSFTVVAFSIVGTETVEFVALEYGGERTHSAFTIVDGDSLGYVVSRILPAEINALPYGDLRTSRVGQFHEMLDQVAKAVIFAAYPELCGVLRFSGGHAMCSRKQFVAAVADPLQTRANEIMEQEGRWS